MADQLARLTCDWLTKAKHDLQNARIVSSDPDGPLDTAIYHCQQAGEKALKGWLTWRGIPVAKTHDLNQLLTDAADDTSDFLKFENATEILTPYVSAFRYPGLSDEQMPSREEFDLALEHAEAIYDFVVNRLPPEAQP